MNLQLFIHTAKQFIIRKTLRGSFSSHSSSDQVQIVTVTAITRHMRAYVHLRTLGAWPGSKARSTLQDGKQQRVMERGRGCTYGMQAYTPCEQCSIKARMARKIHAPCRIFVKTLADSHWIAQTFRQHADAFVSEYVK